MKRLNVAFFIATIFLVDEAFGSESGMPQLNPEFWAAQVFWLILIFSFLYIIVWKIFLPKITYSIESRKSRVVNDLDEAQKLKESAEGKLEKYNLIIENSKKEAKKIIENGRKKLDSDIEDKKQKLNIEIDKEVAEIEKEIAEFKKSSLPAISKIAEEVSAEVIKQILQTEVNKSNASAVIDGIIKKNMETYI